MRVKCSKQLYNRLAFSIKKGYEILYSYAAPRGGTSTADLLASKVAGFSILNLHQEVKLLLS